MRLQRWKPRHVAFSVALAGFASMVPSIAIAGPVGPSPYLQFSDSPWFGTGFAVFHLEDFEDGVLNTLGVTAIGGEAVLPAGGDFTDSVDGDDGVVDGSGTNGRSLYTRQGVFGIEFSFDAGILGGLPTNAGVVWTDLSGVADVFFEAFDSANLSLGVIEAGPLNDGLSTGQTAEDRFLGWSEPLGISRIRIYQSGSDLEIDHLQYGIVPEPAGFLGLLAMALVAAARPRRSCI